MVCSMTMIFFILPHAGNTTYNHILQQPNQKWQVYDEAHTQLGYGYIQHIHYIYSFIISIICRVSGVGKMIRHPCESMTTEICLKKQVSTKL